MSPSTTTTTKLVKAVVCQTTEQVFVVSEHFIVIIAVNWDICPEFVGQADGILNPVSTDPPPKEVWVESKKTKPAKQHIWTQIVYMEKLANYQLKF